MIKQVTCTPQTSPEVRQRVRNVLRLPAGARSDSIAITRFLLLAAIRSGTRDGDRE